MKKRIAMGANAKQCNIPVRQSTANVEGWQRSYAEDCQSARPFVTTVLPSIEIGSQQQESTNTMPEARARHSFFTPSWLVSQYVV
jgi:hypothetical protein